MKKSNPGWTENEKKSTIDIGRPNIGLIQGTVAVTGMQ